MSTAGIGPSTLSQSWTRNLCSCPNVERVGPIALASTLSVRLEVTGTLTLCMSLLVFGLMSDYILGSRAADSPTAAVLYGLVPNWQHFWGCDALTGGGRIPWSYVGDLAVYSLLYAAGTLAAGLALFHRSELG